MTDGVEIYTTRVACDDGLSMAVDVYHPTVTPTEELLPTTVLCHGFKGFRMWGMFPHLARRLAKTGRAVVLFDFSHNGTDTVPEEFTRLDLFEKQTISRHVEDLVMVLLRQGLHCVASPDLRASIRAFAKRLASLFAMRQI